MPTEENTVDCCPYPFEVWNAYLFRILIQETLYKNEVRKLKKKKKLSRKC